MKEIPLEKIGAAIDQWPERLRTCVVKKGVSVQLERVGKLQPADRVATSSSAGIQDCRNLRLFVTDKNTGLRFLVDSGADISIIPPKDKNRMPSSDYKLYAANGTEIVTYGTKVRNLDIGLRRQFQWPFVIANTNRAIIGADFLNNFGLIIDIKNKRLIDGITNLSIRGVIQSISDMGNISTLNSSSKVSAILTKYPNLCRPPSDFVEAKHSVKHYIPTRGQPIHSKARRLDSQRLTLAKAEFQYMLNNGIIRPSNSPWASPLHLVSKKDESLRPCGDYRRLNAVTLPDRYPIPRLDDFHHILKGTRVYSKIDLCKAFYQIPIAEEDKPKTAIITPFGLFEFNVMSFGLRNATATFQRFMHEVLRNLDFAFVYLDDILVASKTEEEYYSHLVTLFSRLNSYGLRINLSKSKFLVQEIDFLGYLITSHGVKPLPTKVKAILEYKKPKTVHELRIFLGMLNFYRTFLNNAAETQAILHEYLRGAKKKDRSEIKWTEEAEVQFEKCKQALANTALLAYPDTELPISLCTDASDRAVGSVLQQLDCWLGNPGALTSLPVDERLSLTLVTLLQQNFFLSREGKAFAKICLGINDEQQLHVQHLNTPKEVWEELEKLYAPKDSRYRAVQLRRQLYGKRLTQHSNMEGYMGKINYIVNELAQIGDKIDDGDLAMVLLGGLPEDWDIVVSTICNLPDSDFMTATVKRRLLAEAERRSSNLPKDVGAMVVNASSKPIETEKQFKAKVVCFKCGGKGHYARECRKKGKNEQRPKRFDQNKGVNMSAMCNTLFGATAETWIIDSGATHHMTPKRDYFTCLKECTSNMSSITIANGSSIEACGIGTVSANIVGHKGDASKMVVQNTLYVPDLRHSVLSVRQMIENGRKVVFNRSGCHIMDMKGKLLIEGKKLGRLYYVQTTPSSPIDQNDHVSLASECKEELTLELWHKRLMHVNAYTIAKMAKNQSVRGLNCSPAKPEKCEDCLIGKSYRLPFLQHSHKEEKEIMPLDLVHADLMGPLDVLSWGGAKYVLTIIDESTRYTSVFFLKNKGETLGKVKEWIQESEKQTSRKLKRIRTDNGLEFCSKEWDTFCTSVGIVHEHTMTYTPQQNGVAERMNRTLLDLVRSTISGSGLPKASWAELTYTAAYVRNRVLNNHNGESTPYELWTGNKPSLKHLRAIGCQVFVHIPRQVRKSKLERRAIKGNLVGYALRGRGYRVWIPEMKKVVESRDCVFKESDVSRNDSNREELPSVEHYSYGTQREIEDNPVSLLDQEDVTPTEEDSHNEDTGDPTSYKEAIQGPEAEHWLEAIVEELESLRKHNVWELTELPKDSAPIACKWVLHKKTNAEGQVVRYKARLVAKGFTQQKGIDYDEIYSPVSSFETTRLLTAIGVENNWFIDQYDVKSAYLYGKLDRVIYMEQPEGFVKPGEEHLYCQLKRSLYGLKQSGRCWNKCLDEWLKKKGFVRNPVDPCVYKLKLNEGMIILSLYVDDILTLTENQEVREKCIELLRGHFETKYIGPVSYLLGVNFTRSKDGCVTLTQRAYIKSLLERFNLQEGREVSTPMETRPELLEEEDEENCQDLPYRELIGGLLYISQRTRPDIAYAVSQLARYCSKYTRKHWVAAKRILRYLKSSEHLGITYRRTGEQLCVYSDADWGTNLEDRKSTSGYVVMFAGAPILWRSSKQTVTALSTMEAEYISLSSSVREVTWIREFLNHLDIPNNMVEPTPVWCDNQAAIAHAKSYISRSKTRHIAIRYHFVREKVDDVADALSRVDAITTMDYEEIAKEQTGDSELQNLISKNTSLKFKQCPLQSGNLLWCDVSTTNIRPFIPIKFRMMVFRNFHELSHPGIKATTKQLTSRFIWPNMNKDIRKWAQACVNCQKCKVSIHTKSEIGKYQEVDERFSVVHIDLIGPLPPSNGNIYCLTCIDRYTSWMEVVPLPDMKSETVARAFYENWIVRFGAPHTVISARGKQFTSQLFKDLTTLCGIKLRHSTAYHPQCNGKIERLHRTIKTAIRAHNNIKWTETLPTVLLGLRAAINKDNNHSLCQMVYGKTIRLPGEFFDDSKHHLHAEEFVQQLQKQMELLKPLNEKHHSKTKVFVHKDLKTCSHVFIRTDRVKKPLEPPYEGPFPVLERTDKYFTLKVKEKNVTTSIDRLRPAYLLADSDNITAEHPTATRPIVSGALPSTSSQQNPDPPDVE
ncbi:hypothetical protein LAZ67_6002864, partial [Cordylochernes scorpioides]